MEKVSGQNRGGVCAGSFNATELHVCVPGAELRDEGLVGQGFYLKVLLNSAVRVPTYTPLAQFNKLRFCLEPFPSQEGILLKIMALIRLTASSGLTGGLRNPLTP